MTGRAASVGTRGASRWAALGVLLLLGPPASRGQDLGQDAPALERSVVRIVNYFQRGDWYSPWNPEPVTQSAGSGFVIEGGLVMTNAHVVSDARLLLVFLHNDPDPHPAEVFLAAHDCDLALVRLKEPGLLWDVPPLPLGTGLPGLGSAVETYGYPVGGTVVSSTRGVVSRIEAQLYAHSGVERHVTVQTDAAINPGNSGGPVVQAGRVIGVAFQAIPGLQSVGYFIPMEVIERFRRDVADGRYDGYPDLGITVAGLENPAARRKAGMSAQETGVSVEHFFGDDGAGSAIRVGDVVLAIDGRPIANDGTILEDGRRLPFGMLADRRQVGEPVTLRLLREGRRLDVTVPLRAAAAVRLRANAYDRRPRYFVYGGLVFVPLELEMLKTYGAQWFSVADKPLLHEYLYRPLEDASLFSKERVVLLRRLDHPVNVQMTAYRNLVVDRVNGRPIDRLEDLIEAIQTNREAFHLFEFASDRRVEVLDREAAEAANEEILRRYGVSKDREL